jgi:hypothetical protein
LLCYIDDRIYFKDLIYHEGTNDPNTEFYEIKLGKDFDCTEADECKIKELSVY